MFCIRLSLKILESINKTVSKHSTDEEFYLLLQNFEKANNIEVKYKICDRRPGDIATCYADSTKAQKELGWTPQHTLADMCKDAWHWQKSNPNGYEE